MYQMKKITYKHMKKNLSLVEQAFYKYSEMDKISTCMPYITVDNFPQLGLFTALRFIEWVVENPNGVISLPTGKTPEHFIKWTKFILDNWNTKKAREIRAKYGLEISKKPELSGLHFGKLMNFTLLAQSRQIVFSTM